MDIAKILTCSEIQEIEQRICRLHGWLFESSEETEILILDIRHLMKRRRKFINNAIMKHQEDLLPDIVEFNEALKNAFRETWNKVAELQSKYGYEDIEASIWFDTGFPQKHPLAGVSSVGDKYSYQALWEALTDREVHSEYKCGIGNRVNTLHLADETFGEFVGVDGATDNWNEGLDAELTKDLHLIMPFHNLFEHTGFAITDFLYVRDFRIEVEIEMDFSYRYEGK